MKIKLNTRKKAVWALLLAASQLCLGRTATASTAFGDLNNFDVINDTGGRCYGFEIELHDVRSTEITYTFDWNHFGMPRISEDLSDPAHPKVIVRYQATRGPDGNFASFTNPQDPLNPLSATDGHSCVDVSVNRGCEHFGVGYYGAPSLVNYHWLVEDPQVPGVLIAGPAVNIATPKFVYYPPVPPPVQVWDPPAAPARVVVVIEPPELPEPAPDQWGVPVWVKSFKTVQKTGKKVRLEDLMSDDEERADDVNWTGDEPPETEIEWMVFQKRPASKPGVDEIEGVDELPEGDETVVRRYEFYVYLGPVNEEDGEAQASNAEDNPEYIGAYIGAQMAGFNVGSPLGLVEHLQDGEVAVAYVERTVVAGGNTPYSLKVTAGALPDGMVLDPVLGVLSGTPSQAGRFEFTVEATDADAVVVSRTYALQIAAPLEWVTAALAAGQEKSFYRQALVVSGGNAPYAWSSGELPTGLVLTPEGVLEGTLAVGTAGLKTIVVRVEDGMGRSTEAEFMLAIEAWVRPVVPGDIDGDSDVDKADLALVLAARNKPASGPNDPRDLDRNGVINILDARIVATLIPKP